MTDNPCRCGHDGAGPHPCHYRGYQCRKPATLRVYSLHLPCFAGSMPKLGASTTYACDECWGEYTANYPAPATLPIGAP